MAGKYQKKAGPLGFQKVLEELDTDGLNPIIKGVDKILAIRKKYPGKLLFGIISSETLRKGSRTDVEKEVLEVILRVAPIVGYV